MYYTSHSDNGGLRYLRIIIQKVLLLFSLLTHSKRSSRMKFIDWSDRTKSFRRNTSWWTGHGSNHSKYAICCQVLHCYGRLSLSVVMPEIRSVDFRANDFNAVLSIYCAIMYYIFTVQSKLSYLDQTQMYIFGFDSNSSILCFTSHGFYRISPHRTNLCCSSM